MQPQSSHNANITTTLLSVPGMHCAGCMSKLEKGVARLKGIQKVRANLSNRTLRIVWDSDFQSEDTIGQAVTGLGFDSHIVDESANAADPVRKMGNRLLLCLAIAGFASANIMLLSVSVWSGAEPETAQLFALISGLIAVPAITFAGRPFFESAFTALRRGRLNMDVPISLAIILSLGMSMFEAMTGGDNVYFEAGVMLLFFLLIGRTLDHFARAKTASGVHHLSKLLPRTVERIDAAGAIQMTDVDDVQTGDRLRLKPGDRFVVDAKVISGSARIDRSVVTGESAPVAATPGTNFEAGSLNLDGLIDVQATSNAQSSFLAEVRTMMEAAQQGRGQYQRIADRMASYYAPAVHLLALISFVGWLWFSGSVAHALTISVAVLIITCPCALGLAVPVTHVVAANRLFGQGVMMRDGSALERLAQIDQVMIDKTGTLTEERLQVSNAPKLDEQDCSILVALAQHSRHPVSKALVAQYGATDALQIDSYTEQPGLGIEATVAGRKARLGRPEWACETRRHQLNDATVVFAVEDGPIVGFTLKSQLRTDARSTIKTLQQMGLKTTILSGDRTRLVADMARDLGADHWLAELTPGDKTHRINRQQNKGSKILMIGDGLNDAPSLTAAHVSMSPSSATDISRNCADFILAKRTLSEVGFAIMAARKAAAIVRQNFGIAIAYNCIAVPMALAGWVTPLFAAIAMSASSLIVVANAMRLMSARLDQKRESKPGGVEGRVKLPNLKPQGA